MAHAVRPAASAVEPTFFVAPAICRRCFSTAAMLLRGDPVMVLQLPFGDTSLFSRTLRYGFQTAVSADSPAGLSTSSFAQTGFRSANPTITDVCSPGPRSGNRVSTRSTGI